MSRGKRIVLTAPFTEMIDHAGYFIQMGMASIPIWMEWVMDKKYPEWRNVKRFEDGSAQAAPAGLRVLERVMATGVRPQTTSWSVIRTTSTSFIGPDTRIVALSTHNPLGVTFAAGVYTSIFGSSREPINSHYAAKLLFEKPSSQSPHRASGSGCILGRSRRSWQITQTKSYGAARHRLRHRRPQRVGGDHQACSGARIEGGELPDQVEVEPIRPTGSDAAVSGQAPRRSAWSR